MRRTHKFQAHLNTLLKAMDSETQSRIVIEIAEDARWDALEEAARIVERNVGRGRTANQIRDIIKQEGG